MKEIYNFFFFNFGNIFPMAQTSQKDCKWTLWAVPTTNPIGS